MFEIGLFGALGLLGGVAGAWIGGRADSRFGPKPVIVATIVAVMVFSCIVISTGPNEVLLIGVGTPEAPSSLPTIVFYVCGTAIGAAAGPLLAASRTMLVWQADEDRMTEAFGLFALAGKVTSFATPFLIAVATEASGSQRVGVTPILFLFLVGLVGMAWVDARGAAGNGGRRPLGQRQGVIPGGSPGRRMQAHGVHRREHRRPAEAGARRQTAEPPPSGTASSRDRRSPLRMDGGTPGSFGCRRIGAIWAACANSRIPVGAGTGSTGEAIFVVDRTTHQLHIIPGRSYYIRRRIG